MQIFYAPYIHILIKAYKLWIVHTRRMSQTIVKSYGELKECQTH